jgi:hypothetical protein
MQRAKSGQEVVADFFSQGYRVSGAFSEGNRALPDVVYDLNTDYLLIRDAYLSSITDPAAIATHYATALLAKRNLEFVLVMDQKDGLRRDQHFTLGSHTFDLCVSVPFFEIRGRLHSQLRTFDPRAFLGSGAGPFITLLDATARCTFGPNTSYQGGAVLINRAAISFLGEQERPGT